MAHKEFKIVYIATNKHLNNIGAQNCSHHGSVSHILPLSLDNSEDLENSAPLIPVDFPTLLQYDKSDTYCKESIFLVQQLSGTISDRLVNQYIRRTGLDSFTFVPRDKSFIFVETFELSDNQAQVSN